MVFAAAQRTVDAHQPGRGLMIQGEGGEASLAYGVTMAGLVLTVVATLLGSLIYFRWRSLNPLPEPESVQSVLAEAISADQMDPSMVPEATWEKPANWWKDSDDSSPQS